MGLAVSQVRLLALTRRKADIELDIQIDSKRKQALTRKSTELSQTYYQKLQQSKIQYATSDGYENVNYDYVMGKTDGTAYSAEFLRQVMIKSGNIAQKSCNSMILTNNYGKVVLNDELSGVVFKVQSAYGDKSTEEQTSEAIKTLISQSVSVEGYDDMYKLLKNLDVEKNLSGGSSPDSIEIISKLLKNGGYMDGGTVYEVDGFPGFYTTSAEKARSGADLHEGDFVTLQDGYNYTVLKSNGAIADKETYTCMYDKSKGTFVKNTAKLQMQYLSNIITYFAPMISAALKNGMTSDVKVKGVTSPTDSNVHFVKRSESITDDNPEGVFRVSGTKTPEDVAKDKLNGTANNNHYCIVQDKDGSISVWQNIGGAISRVSPSCLELEIKEHNYYANARDTKVLQAGFQSGMYQLCMVDNMAKGRYHKNTTLDFFIQMSYVSEKLDSSAREEITAWFNAEQAKISEQETYWDTEITNLSTELSSVNTEIDSVKTLKSNAIKSVFDWGSS